MKMKSSILLLLPLLIFARDEVYTLSLSGPIGPAARDYIRRGVREAHQAQASLILLKLDTPGGLDLAMREICQEILNSNIPFLTFVYPPGARAVSAGTFILMASHLAAMAQGTSCGACHPVTIGGKEISEEMKMKMENDASAYLLSLARARNRDTIFAREAVKKSATLDAEGAFQRRVIDFLANSEEELLKKVKERGIKIGRIRNLPMSPREKLLHHLTEPNLAYILLTLGMYGIILELQSPGTILPGIFGTLSLSLALYSFQILPVNYVGLILIFLSFLLFFLELKITSYGLLTIGGIILFFLGSTLLFPRIDFPLSPKTVLIAGIATVIFFLLILLLGIRAQGRRVQTGPEGMINLIGEVVEDFSETGQVFVRGEYWKAISLSGSLKKGEKVRVVSISDMVLKVERIEKTQNGRDMA